MRTLHLLPTFHHDIAYLRRCDEYLIDCEKILDEALGILTADPSYTFMVEQVFLLDWYWNKRPDQQEALRGFYAEGRLTLAPGLWTVPDLNLPDGESFLQQARLGKDWIAKHLTDKTRKPDEPRVCWIADCWGHPPQMPQLAKLAGYESYIFWRCMRPEEQQADFTWRGLDGSEVLGHWLARGYANLRFPTEAEAVNAAELTFNNTSASGIEALVRELDGYGAQDDQLICNGGDMAFPQSTAPKVVAQIEASGFPDRLRFSSLQSFFDSRDQAALSVLDGEFNSAFTGTYTSNIRLKLLNRACTERLLALEKLAVLRGVAPDFDPLWKLLLKQQFHDTICGTIADGALEDACREFAELECSLDAVEGQLAGTSGNSQGIEWFNACSFPRTAWCGGNDQPASLIDLPAHGSSPLSTARLLEAIEGGTLPSEFKTPHYRARFDSNGFITSLIEAQTGSECVQSGPGPFGAIAMVPDYGDLWLNHTGPLNGGSFQSALTQNRPDPLFRGPTDDIVNTGPFWPRILDVRVISQGPVVLIFEQRGRLNFWQLTVEFTTQVRLCAALPQIEYRTQFTPQGRNFRLRAVFGTPFADGENRYEVPFGVTTRGRGEHAAQHFVDLRGPKAGLAVFNRGTAGHAIEDGAVLMSMFRSVAMEYKAPSSLSYAEGIPHEIHYAVMPHPGAATSELVRAGAAFNQQPIVTATAVPGGDFSTGSDHVIVTSLRAAQEGYAVRLAETIGEPAILRVCFPARITRWAMGDGLGRRTGPWHSLEGTPHWQGELTSWQILTLICR